MAALADPLLRRFTEEALSDGCYRVLDMLTDEWQSSTVVADQLLLFDASKGVRMVQREVVRCHLWFLARVGLAQTRLVADDNPSAPDGAMVRNWRRTD